MRIESISLALPSRPITNDFLLHGFEQANQQHLSSLEVSALKATLRGLLENCGSQIRYYRDRDKGETALGLINEAARDALGKARCAATDIDLLIYCGITRGVLEPATAYVVARSLGLQCEAFDVLDACMGWVRALHIAHSFLRAGTYRRILIICAECSAYEYGYPELLRVSGARQLLWTFPAMTVGEAAAATVVTNSPEPWNFYFESDPSKAALCAIPIRGITDFDPNQEFTPNGIDRFMARGRELTSWAVRRISAAATLRYPNLDEIDLIVPHAASLAACSRIGEQFKVGPKVYTEVVRKIGNVASVSIPAALVLAEKDGRLRRGHRVLLCPVSAGMSLGLVDVVY